MPVVLNCPVHSPLCWQPTEMIRTCEMLAPVLVHSIEDMLGVNVTTRALFTLAPPTASSGFLSSAYLCIRLPSGAFRLIHPGGVDPPWRSPGTPAFWTMRLAIPAKRHISFSVVLAEVLGPSLIGLDEVTRPSLNQSRQPEGALSEPDRPPALQPGVESTPLEPHGLSGDNGLEMKGGKIRLPVPEGTRMWRRQRQQMVIMWDFGKLKFINIPEVFIGFMILH